MVTPLTITGPAPVFVTVTFWFCAENPTAVTGNVSPSGLAVSAAVPATGIRFTAKSGGGAVSMG